MKRQILMAVAAIATVFSTLGLCLTTSRLRADIYEWTTDGSGNVIQSSTVCPGGSGVSAGQYSYLPGLDLTKAYLIGSYLPNADLIGTTLTKANLTDANLTNAFLYLSTLTNANLTNANLASATSSTPI